MASFWCLNCERRTDFTQCFDVSIVDLEHVKIFSGITFYFQKVQKSSVMFCKISNFKNFVNFCTSLFNNVASLHPAILITPVQKFNL